MKTRIANIFDTTIKEKAKTLNRSLIASIIIALLTMNPILAAVLLAVLHTILHTALEYTMHSAYNWRMTHGTWHLIRTLRIMRSRDHMDLCWDTLCNVIVEIGGHGAEFDSCRFNQCKNSGAALAPVSICSSALLCTC